MRSNLVIDLIALIVYLLVANPAITGVPLHEWFGLGIFVVFIVHTVQHYDWVIDSFKSIFKRFSLLRHGRLILDILIVISFMICMVSGILISGTVLPEFALYSQGYYFWDPLHAVSAKVLLALLLIHVIINGGILIQKWRHDRQKPEGSK